jgi:hypothetical protein
MKGTLAFLLLLALLLGLSLVTGTRRWRHIAAFSFGFVLLETVSLYLTIYVFHKVDWKFREAPILEFKIGLADAGLTSVVATVAMAAGVLFADRVFESQARQRHWSHSLLAGIMTPLAAGLFNLLSGSRLPELAYDVSMAVLLALPVLYCLTWIKGPPNPPGAAVQAECTCPPESK